MNCPPLGILDHRYCSQQLFGAQYKSKYLLPTSADAQFIRVSQTTRPPQFAPSVISVRTS